MAIIQRYALVVGLIGALAAIQQPSLAAAKGDARAIRLYEEVKRLNAACVAAGGGVSGSPDCDAAIAKEDQLKGLGYCIDYPHKEALAKCGQIKRQPRR